LRAGAVIFIVLAFVLISKNMAGSFGKYLIDEETEIIRKSSFIYASQYLNPEEVILEEVYIDGEFFENLNIVIQDNAFLAMSSPAAILSYLGEERSGIVNYTVQSGDIPSQIAAAFGVSTNTLLWANNLSAWDYIKPGQKLVILPVSGIKHKVKKGEKLDAIVKKYKADLEKTIKFNGLPADEKLAIGQEIIIPDGQKPVYYYPQTRSYATYANFPRPYATQSHRFPWGQCTWYVAQRRYVPWSGHAKSWIYTAPYYGFSTGSTPKTGAIVQTRESGYYGHVAYVESVNGPYITISEMHLGRGIRKVRTLHVNDWRIIGYIY
jgi:surface antigen